MDICLLKVYRFGVYNKLRLILSAQLFIQTFKNIYGEEEIANSKNVGSRNNSRQEGDILGNFDC